MKRWLTGLAILPFLSLSAHAAPALDGGASEAEAVLDRAIKACGGEQKLAKLQAVVKATGTTILASGATTGPINYEIFCQRPDRVRYEYLAGAAAGATDIRVYDGDSGWMTLNGGVRDIPKTSWLIQVGPECAVACSAELLMIKGKGYKLTPLGKVKLGDQSAVGVRVSGEGSPNITHYFDRDTNLLLKRVTTIPSRVAGGEDTDIEILYEDYKEADKIKFASKVTIIRSGQKWYMDVSEFKTVDKLDDSLFKKPE